MHPIHDLITKLDEAFHAVREHIAHDATVKDADQAYAELRGHLAVHARDLEAQAENDADTLATQAGHDVHDLAAEAAADLSATMTTATATTTAAETPTPAERALPGTTTPPTA